MSYTYKAPKDLESFGDMIANALVPREEGSESFVLREGLPEKVEEGLRDLIMSCHEGYLPCDITYRMVRDVACYVSDYGEDDQDLHGLVPVYTGDLLEWVGSNGTRQAMMDDVLAVPQDTTLYKALSEAYMQELQEVFWAICSAWEAWEVEE